MLFIHTTMVAFTVLPKFFIPHNQLPHTRVAKRAAMGLSQAIRRSATARKRRQQTAPLPAPVEPDERLRAGKVIMKARDLLETMRSVPEDANVHKIVPKQLKIGGPEAVGTYCRIALLNVGEDGSLSDADMVRLRSEGELIMDMWQNVMLNWSVIFSLFMTIFVSVAILHTGSPAYATLESQHTAFGMDGPSEYTDLASFIWPEDEQAQADARRRLYTGEVVMVAIGITCCASALIIVLILYTAFGASIPDLMTKFEIMYQLPNTLGLVWAFFDGLVCFVPLTVAFATARSSALMSIASFCSTIVVQMLLQVILPSFGVANVMTLASHRCTLRVLRATGRMEAEAASAAVDA